MPSFRLRAVLIAVLIAAFGAAGCVQAQETEPEASYNAPSFQDTSEYNLIYVPTPPEVVDRMMELGGVTAQDTVFDLGSGDGRMVIRAAKQHGAYGVGIEIDQELVAEARKNATKAGVTDRVEFREQDFFKADISDATVLLLYLLPDKLEDLQPKLIDELETGTPIVTHDFRFHDWEPEKSVRIPVSSSFWGGQKTIYLWRVPEE